MRWILGLLSFFFLLVGVCLFLVMQQTEEGNYSQLQGHFGEVLLRGTSAAADQLEKNIIQSEQAIQNILVHAKKRETADNALLALNMPRFIYSETHRVHAPDFIPDEELLASVKDFLGEKQKLSLESGAFKKYLLLSGNTEEGEKYVAAYDPENFFSFLRTADGVSRWVVSRDAEVLFHPQVRFWGEDVSNSKPLASGLRALAEGRANELVSSYVGLDGREALGAWATIPKLGLLLGSEWPSFTMHFEHANGPIFWGVWLFLAAGFFCFGMFISKGAEKQRKKPKEETIGSQESHLDADTIDFLENARRASEEAIALCLQKDEVIEKLENTIRRQGLQIREKESKLGFLEVLSALKRGSTGKKVWQELVSLLAIRMPGSFVLFYRYSAASFSLIPECTGGLESLDPNGKLFLEDARIFIGNFFRLSEIRNTDAFRNWEELRLRHMPLYDLEAEFLPFGESSDLCGCILLLTEKNGQANALNKEILNYLREEIRQIKQAQRNRGPRVEELEV